MLIKTPQITYNQLVEVFIGTPNGLIFESTTRFSPKIERRFLKI